MAIAQVSLPDQPTQTVGAKQHVLVKVRKLWSDDWQIVPYLHPQTLEQTAAPEVGRGTFIWRVGEIKHEDINEFVIERAQQLFGWYVRVELVGESVAEGVPIVNTALWHGQFIAESHQIGGTQSGVTVDDQELTAYEIMHALDRTAIDRSYFYNAGLKSVDRVIDFESHVRGGRLDFGGNCSASTYDGPFGLGVTNVFDENGNSWNTWRIMRYLLACFQASDELQIEAFAGPTADTYTIFPKVDSATWSSVKDGLDDLFDRRHGIGWTIDIYDTYDGDGNVNGDYARLRLFTYTDEAIKDASGTQIISANDDVARIDLRSEPNVTVEFDYDESAIYDTIIVRGELILSCFTVSMSDLTLEEGWTTAQETRYNDADDDRARLNDKSLATVFTRFLIPTEWNWNAGSHTNGTLRNVLPTCLDDGTVVTDSKPYHRTWGYRILRWIPMVDPNGGRDGNGEPAYKSPLVIIGNAQAGELFDPATDGYYDVTAPPTGESFSNLPRCHVRLLEEDFGFQLEPSVNHLIASVAFTGTSETDAVVDHQTIAATVATYTDEHLQVIVKTNASGDGSTSTYGRTKIIRVEDAHYWWIAPQSVKGLNASGLLEFHQGGAQRDDSDRLKAIAAVAKTWYAGKRPSVSVTWQRINSDYRVGQLIETIVGWDRENVGTVITSIVHDLSGDEYTTTIRTNWEDLAFGEVVL